MRITDMFFVPIGIGGVDGRKNGIQSLFLAAGAVPAETAPRGSDDARQKLETRKRMQIKTTPDETRNIVIFLAFMVMVILIGC